MTIDYHKLAQQLEDTLDPLDEDEYGWTVEIEPDQTTFFNLCATTRKPVDPRGRFTIVLPISIELLEDVNADAVYSLRDLIRKRMAEELKYIEEEKEDAKGS